MASPTPELEQTNSPVASTITEHPVAAAMRQKRVLACVSCQQRKVKCDRQFPCAHCLRADIPCVPAGLVPRQRRRRFAEKDLLERLRHYEALLRQSHVDFQPLHPISPASAKDVPTEHTSPTTTVPISRGQDSGASDPLDDPPSNIPCRDKTPVQPDSKPVDLWHAMSRVMLDHKDDDSDDDDDEGSADISPKNDNHDDGGSNVRLQGRRNGHLSVTQNAWGRDDTYKSDQTTDKDHLLFGDPKINVHLSTFHPEQVQIFRLWQIYLENVNPLLKVTHTPSLQPRIINAVSDLEKVKPTLEALIFSIYCVAIMSLSDQECHSLFSTPRRDLLAGYQFACKQSLLNCRAFQSGNLESLTALYLYLVSVRSQTDPRSLSSMLAVAIRIAQRLGMSDESTHSNCTALEAEMRRRLWWSLVTFDHRLCEMSDYKTTTLTPIWDCEIPLNVNDFELRPEMKSSPTTHDRKPTEALFAVVRSELADFIRHGAFHINFINPSLNAIARPKHGPAPDGEELTLLEKTVEDKYFKFCDPETPLHFMTIWTTRAFLARSRLLEHYSRFSTSSVQQTDAQRRAAVSHALSMLECETRLRTSPLTKGFLWHVDSNVPALAYIHILNGLKKRPDEEHADRAWEAMSDNYEARAAHSKPGEYGIADVFSRVVLQVWAAREELCKEQGKPVQPPRIVSMFRNRAKGSDHPAVPSQQADPDRSDSGAIGIGVNQSLSRMPVSFEGLGPGGNFLHGSGFGALPDMPGPTMMDVDMDQILNPVDWRWMHVGDW
ncbi:hypothetical protein diail_1871 [Diaporthe ilicicola]|nr:hypothetical protein diail_1871 [Diaporthe ilicicola]